MAFAGPAAGEEERVFIQQRSTCPLECAAGQVAAPLRFIFRTHLRAHFFSPAGHSFCAGAPGLSARDARAPPIKLYGRPGTRALSRCGDCCCCRNKAADGGFSLSTYCLVVRPCVVYLECAPDLTDSLSPVPNNGPGIIIIIIKREKRDTHGGAQKTEKRSLSPSLLLPSGQPRSPIYGRK